MKQVIATSTGSFAEINNARKCLLAVLDGRGPTSQPDTLNTFPTEPSSEEEKDASYGAVVNPRKDEELEELGLLDQGQEIEGSSQPMIYDSETIFQTYLTHFYEKKLTDIQITFDIKITWDNQDSKVILTPNPSCNRKKFLAANEVFVSFYQDVHKNMTLKRLTLENTSGDKRKIILRISKEFSVLIERSEDRKQWTTYGEEESVEAALDELRKAGRVRLEPLARPDGSSKSADDNTDQSNTDLVKTLPGNVKISVYQGDITEEKVEAIVNAANEWLSHGAGVALAIKDKGGRVIDKESREITNRRGHLKVGEAVHTSSGHLPCKYIIHSVGPEWRKEGDKNSRKLLRAACLNSLTEAEQLEVDSIVLPAISSGIYGMPKEVCAEVMFDAVEEYSTQLVPQQGFAVTDIRFVNIDDATVKVFRDEFVKRYGSSRGAHPTRQSSFKGKSKTKNGHFQEEREVSATEKHKRENKSGNPGPAKPLHSSHMSGGGRRNRSSKKNDNSSGAGEPPPSSNSGHRQSSSGTGTAERRSYSEVATSAPDDTARGATSGVFGKGHSASPSSKEPQGICSDCSIFSVEQLVFVCFVPRVLFRELDGSAYGVNCLPQS